MKYGVLAVGMEVEALWLVGAKASPYPLLQHSGYAGQPKHRGGDDGQPVFDVGILQIELLDPRWPKRER
jgi:hypothetical protein